VLRQSGLQAASIRFAVCGMPAGNGNGERERERGGGVGVGGREQDTCEDAPICNYQENHYPLFCSALQDFVVLGVFCALSPSGG
jgi:hypothetical protein